MKCTSCGNDIPDGYWRCPTCYYSDTQSNHVERIKKYNVAYLIIICLVTAGIFVPIWFLKNVQAINSLKSNIKINYNTFLILLIMTIISKAFLIASFVYDSMGINDTMMMLEIVSETLDLVIGIMIIIQAFKVKAIISDHFITYLDHDDKLSILATFFFTIFYLQYKINRFVTEYSCLLDNKLRVIK